jgi:hypothetical protein
MALKVFKKMRYGRACACGLLMVSLLCIGFNLYFMYTSGKYFPKMFMVGIMFLILAPVMFMFPGGKFTQEDYPDEKIGLSFFWNNSPKLHRVIWVIAFIGGLGVAMYIEHFLKG